MARLDIHDLFIQETSSIREAAECINRNLRGIALVVDEDRRLLDTVTDGDIRRAVLDGVPLESPVTVLSARKGDSPYSSSIRAPMGTSKSGLLLLMQKHNVKQLPITDRDGRVESLVVLEDLLPEEVVPIQAVVMAGGFGTRLRPLTDETPKPMLPIGDRPLLERIIDRLKAAGIRRVNITTHFQPEKIQAYFGNGEAFGVDLEYVNEDQPLGTAGALGLMVAPDGPQLVINGDILTQVDYRAMLAFHQEHSADLTAAVRQYDLRVPYGVIECDGVRVRQVREKPVYNFFVNAGMYLLEPSVYDHIPQGQYLDMPELIQRLIAAGRTVVCFPVVEYWLDIGQHIDYRRAQKDLEAGRIV